MPISPEERKRLAAQLRKLAAQEDREEIAAEFRRRADFIEAGGDGSGGSALDNTSQERAPPKLA